MNDREELIRRRAYAIWEQEGRPEGQDKRHWEQASCEMTRGDAPSPMEETEGATGALSPPASPPPRREADNSDAGQV